MITETDRLNALLVEHADEIAGLKKTIEWYQAQAAQMMGAAARAEIAAAPAQGAGGVPVGFKLVPMEPTPEMIRAGENSTGRSTMKNMESYSLIYRDMLAAAPAAPLPEQTGPASFKNFHRALCDRFNYMHDEQFWWRDEVSLIEHIAATSPSPAPAQPAEPSIQHQRDALAVAIRDAAVKAGIARAETPLTGPHLIMFCQDMASIIAGAAPAQQQELSAPTDITKELRQYAGEGKGYAAMLVRSAADEIERYYGGMMVWKRTAEAKDRASAETAAPGASIGDNPEFNRLIGQLIAEDNALSVEGIVEALVAFLDRRVGASAEDKQ